MLNLIPTVWKGLGVGVTGQREETRWPQYGGAMDLKRQDGDYRTQSLDLRSSGRGYLVLGKWLFFWCRSWSSNILVIWCNSLEKSLMLGKTEGRRRRVCQRLRWLDGNTNARNMYLGKLWEMVRDREAWCAAAHGVEKSWTWLGNWTITTNGFYLNSSQDVTITQTAVVILCL